MSPEADVSTDSPSVTVIVPNYNYEKTLATCLDAVFAQTYPVGEVLVVDDHSTDTSLDIARRYPCRIVSTPSNSGVAAARNTGIRESDSDVLFFVDSDVRLDPDAVANAVRRLREDPSLGSVCGIYHPEPLFDDGIVERYRSLQAHFWRASSVGRVTPGFFSLGAVRREVFDRIGLFDTRLRQTEEVEFGCRMANAGSGLYLAADVAGSHDDDADIVDIWRKLFRRGRLRVPLYVDRRGFMTGFETPARGIAAVSALGALLTVPLGAIAPGLLAVPAGLAVTSLACDLDLYRFVARVRRRRFVAFFTAAHFSTNVAIAAGLVAGVAQWSASRTFRTMYAAVGDEPAPEPDAVAAAA